MYNILLALIIGANPALVQTQSICTLIQDDDRIDCHPAPFASEEKCRARGCCWKDVLAETNPAVPMCYFPHNYNNYEVVSVEKTVSGYRYRIEKSNSSFMEGDILKLNVDIIYVSSSIVRIKITDPEQDRFEVPYVYTKENPTEAIERQLEVHVTPKPFSLQVTNNVTKAQIIDTSIGPLLYSDQFIQFSTKIVNNFVYGLGEHRNPLKYSSSWQSLTFWTRDQAPAVKQNLYGANPFALFLDKEGNSYGMFFLNSNAMEAVLQPSPAITFRTIGGIIDFFVYAGNTPAQVIQQHWSIVEAPYFQPYWAMGFHLSRYGYTDVDDLKNVIDRMNATQFPYDVQWTDIDAMHNKLVFTYDKEKWGSLPEVVSHLHENNMRYIPIFDPCIGAVVAVGQYPTLDEGMKYDLFIKDANGKNLIGNVWPGDCYFPDYTHPNAKQWWKEEIEKFNNTIPFDGLWIDMNEPASFVDGSVGGCPVTKLDDPWYVPRVAGDTLKSRTVCLSAKQSLDSHYNLHNLYGYTHAKVTSEAVSELNPNKRHFILTRSTFAGSGRYAAHWSGDNFARWDDMYYSIAEVINFNMFGMTFIGCDICGFFENSTEELCMRWMQLGAFFPFMRNHNCEGNIPQDPAIWSAPARAVMKSALIMRYKMLPFWYTLHYKASKNEMTVIQPLFFSYTKDHNTYGLDTQFMIGNAIMVAPILQPNATAISIYFPDDNWYSFPDGELVKGNGWINYPVKPESLFLFTREGYIIPLHIIENQNLNAEKNRGSDFALHATLKETGISEGYLYWDDGETMNAQYTLLRFGANDKQLWIKSITTNYAEPMYIDVITIVGITSNKIKEVTFDKSARSFNVSNNVLTVSRLKTNMNTNRTLTLSWTYM